MKFRFSQECSILSGNPTSQGRRDRNLLGWFLIFQVVLHKKDLVSWRRRRGAVWGGGTRVRNGRAQQGPPPSRASLSLPRRQLERRLGGGGGCSFRAGVTAPAALGWADGSDGSGAGDWIPSGDRVDVWCPGVGGSAGAVAQ